MIKYLIIGLILISTNSFGQIYKINHVKTDSIFIGVNNVLQIEGFTRNDKISIKTSRNIRNRKCGRHSFCLVVSRPFYNDSIIILKGEEIIDTITISAFRTKLDQFIETDSYGLIRSGEYSLNILKQLRSIKVKINVPWIGELLINKYLIEVVNKKEKIIFSKTMYSGSFDDQEIKTMLNRLKRGDVIKIRNIIVRTPYDDGERPKRFKFTVKQ